MNAAPEEPQTGAEPANRAAEVAGETIDPARERERSLTLPESGTPTTLPGVSVPSDMSTTGPTSAPGLRTTNVPAGMQTRVPGMMTTQGTEGSPEQRGRPISDVRAMALTPGTVIDGKYRLEAMLGRGGMGVVWRAEHFHLHGRVAIKFLLDRFRSKPQVIERFWQEAKLMGELGHPNIVRVLDISPASIELPYITMELMTQGSLRDHLKKSGGTLPTDEAVELMDGVLSALIAAHKRGIVHRDIKPDNLMLADIRNLETDTFEPQLKILDFGASLLMSASPEQNAAEGLLGTPYYMSPEQASGMPLDQRTDLYSTAVVLYELISGKLPHTGEDVHTLVYSIATEEPTPIVQHVSNITRPYREFFNRALEMEPARRFQTAEEMRESLRKLSRRLAGKVRNTALYMASGDTGPSTALSAEQAGRPDTKPMISFRKALDSKVGKLPPTEPLADPVRQPARVNPLPLVLGGLLGAPLGIAVESVRLGSVARASPAGLVIACLALALVGATAGWLLTRRPP